MRIRVGLTSSDLTSLKHPIVVISSQGKCTVLGMSNGQATASLALEPGATLKLGLKNGMVTVLQLAGTVPGDTAFESVEIRPVDERAPLTINSLKRQRGNARVSPSYIGTISVVKVAKQLRLVLETELDTYVKGVLQSEIPASYHIEAIKSQAVAARTYALRPRIDHAQDACQVCDSFLCCQYFAGNEKISARHNEAIESTAGEILVFEDKPILALFSSCSGGHTESYVDCFSDPKTGAFPPPPLPYLTAVPEGTLPFETTNGITENDLRKLWSIEHPSTADAWSPHFRWHTTIAASSLEAQLHHQVDVLRKAKEMAPFIVPPPGGTFGHIDTLEITRRGIAGTAIELAIKTSAGVWKVRKELVIRSVFKNPEIGLARLKSARMFFDMKRDTLGLLSSLTVRGFGWGHGVGMQQTGAQGHALSGKTYRQILAHYFTGAQLTRV